jgi:hypothetical protein
MKGNCGEVSANFNQSWRVVLQPVAWLAFPLTVAVRPVKKPCIYAGFNSLNTDGHGFFIRNSGRREGRDLTAKYPNQRKNVEKNLTGGSFVRE